MKPDGRHDVGHAELLRASYRRWTGRDLLKAEAAGKDIAQALFDADFALVSHGTETDPAFNYGNTTALRLFEMDWSAFTRLPSRLSAEPATRTERETLMATVTTQGFVDDYRGLRISANGRRFMIERATIWNLIDGDERYHGQAAKFDRWTFL